MITKTLLIYNMQIVITPFGAHLFALALFVIQILFTFSTSAYTNISTDQSALLALKSQLILDPSHILWNNWSASTPVCSWIGVTCGSRHQRVTALDVSSMELAGNLPPETGNLSFLMSFNLSRNYFRGNLPEEMSRLRRLQVIDFSVNNFTGDIPSWFQFLDQLKLLYLTNNSFSGPLPNSFANISNLEKLDLSFNSLQGELPRAMGNVHSLRELVLRNNKLSGTIPVEVFNISKLERLSLRDNSFSGGLPSDMCLGIPWIQELRLAYNQLEGQIPSTLPQCSRLRILSLSVNKFIGSIPSEIGNLSTLEILYLGGNNMTGEIPRFIGNLTRLTKLDVRQNNLTGEIPRSVGNLTKLTWFDVRSNNLIGAVPEEICNLSNLERLSLGFNGLIGLLPDKIFNISTLQTISVYHNQLSGMLPNFLGYGLDNLQELDLGSNSFTGQIPESISNASNIVFLQLSNNSFSGYIPSSLGKLRLLRELRLHRNTFICQARELRIITSLTNCTTLEVISLEGNPNLRGTLPVTVGNFTSSLLYFNIQDSGLFGNIPNEICNLSTLILLALNGNMLTGSIPECLSNLKQLQILGLFDNKLRGTIPDGVCKLKNLAELWLYKNQLTGSIPECIGELTSLSVLHIGDNLLSSEIPMSLWQIKDLLELELFSNSLTGYIPQDVGNMKSLIECDISVNQFSSNIPESIGNLQNLIYLSLANNRFSGSIPESIKHMLSLVNLNLSHNNLSGNIPNSLQSLRYLSSFDVSFNELSGHIPSNGSFKNFGRQLFMSNEGLCGDPIYGVRPCRNANASGSRKRKIVVLIVCALLGVTLLVSTMALVLIITSYKRNNALITQTSVQLETAPIRVSYYDIVNSTEGFNESNLIGVGGCSSVYKGTFRDGKLVAIKVLDLQVESAYTNFDTECELLSSLRHRNICKIIGVCSNESFKGLVLEYMSNGSLEQWLYSDNFSLDIMQRVKAMVDVACALEYLHHGYSQQVVHRDLKPSNVLFDENMIAHLSDFGISKLLSEGDSISQTTTLATFGYMAPEYGSEGLVSIKCDVYSYGIMLMEVFTRRKPSSEIFVGDLSLRRMVHESWPNEIMRVIDSRLLRHDEELLDQMLECLSSIMELSLKCSIESPNERIGMKDVVVQLRKIQMKLFSYSKDNMRRH